MIRPRAEPCGGSVIRVNAHPRAHRIAAKCALVAAIALAAASGLAQTGSYTVRRGDTLTTIAAKQHTTVQALAQANGITNPNMIVIGQTLNLPGTSGGAATANTAQVQPGDTLTKIARRTGVSTATLIAANGMPSPYNVYTGGYLYLSVRNGAPTSALARCPVAGAKFMNDWGFARSDTGMHQGNDMFAKRGTPVVAPASGTVTQGWGSIGGNYIQLVAADGTRYYGAHLDKFGKAGKVKAGDIIGYVGNTGDADGGPTHLHFEIHPAGGAAVNPYTYLAKACR